MLIINTAGSGRVGREIWYQMLLRVGRIVDGARHDGGGREEGTWWTLKR